MLIKIAVMRERANGTEYKHRELGVCVTDNITRALELYEDDLSEDVPERLIYEDVTELAK